MVVDIQKGLKSPGEKFGLFLSGEVPGFSFAGDDYRFDGPVQVNGEYSCEDRLCRLEARLIADVQTSCVRCLSDTLLHIDTDMTEEYSPDINANDPEKRTYSGSTLDLDEAVIADVIVNLPIRVLCRADCKGICSECGKNLNEGQCGCSR
jgi:uncharacterized protein